MKLYKQIETTFDNGYRLQVSISNDNRIMVITSTVNVRPKNRKQKKFFKNKSSEFKKVGKGLYSVTLTCRFNAEVFARMMDKVYKDEEGNIGFSLEDNKY